MEQIKKRNWLKEIVIWLISAICMIGATCLGVVLRSCISFAIGGLIATSCLLVLLVAGSLLALGILNRKLKAANLRSFNEYLDLRRARIQKDEIRDKRGLNRACVLTVLYILLLVLSVLGICFFSGAADVGITTIPVVGMFLLYGLIARLFRKKEKPDYSKALREDEYPELYGLARESAGIGPDVPLYIFPGVPAPAEECNAGVAQEGNAIHLLLGPMLLCVLTKEELRQIIRHEVAHVDLEHTREHTRFARMMDYLVGENAGGIFDIWTSFVLRFPANYLLLKGQFYFMLSSSAKESRADSQAADAGDIYAQACALAKTNAHTLFLYEQEPYTNLYRSETIPEDFSTARIRQFRDQLIRRGDFWREILEKELPSRVASHPTFRQRWEALGNCPYDLEPAPDTGEFARECWAVAAESDRRMMEIGNETYTQLRQEHYLDPLQTVQNYEKDGVLLSPEEMRPVILAYYSLGMPEQAEALCDRLMEENESVFATAFARYWKGVLMLYRYDKAGLELVYQAMETNRNYIEEGLDMIGKFCTMTGLEAELNDYRSRAVDYMQTSRDYSSGGIHRKANLSPEKLPEDWRERILAYILKVANGNIHQVYLVHEVANKDYEPSSFVLRYREGTAEEECGRIYDCIFRLLDDWPTDWEFCLYDYEPSMEKPLAAVAGACIYDADLA